MQGTGKVTEQEIRTIVRDFIVNNFLFNADSRDLDDRDSFLEKGIVDSTGILEVVGFIEETFQFKMADTELLPENLDSVANLVRFVGTKVNGRMQAESREDQPGIARQAM